MSLIRQVWLLLALTLVLALSAALGISLGAARQALQDQVALKNADAAGWLALAVAQSAGQGEAREAALDKLLARQFPASDFVRLAWLGADGQPLYLRQAPPGQAGVPAWFIAALPIDSTPASLPVLADKASLGRVEAQAQTAFAHRQLWGTALDLAAWMGGAALLVALLAGLGVRRLRRPLQATVRQAAAITERHFITVREPAVPELREVTRAMNTMVGRLKHMFEEQAAQVEQLRRQANCDALTGLSNRGHFMGRLKVVLNSEDGSTGGALVLVRLVDLQGLNRRLGHPNTDRLLQQAAAAIIESARRTGSSEVGRLNGSDFALVLHDVGGSLREPAVDVAARLRNLLRAHDGAASAVVGAVRWWHGAPVSSLLAAADQALARAEARGPYAVELDDSGDGLVLGEDSWRGRLQSAVVEQRARLVEFPLVDMSGAVLHRECPLRLQLEPDGPLVPASDWLPMARRTHLTARIDLLAARLALQAIEADSQVRSVNVSPGSLLDSGFLPGLRSLLESASAAAPGLWLELAEDGALRHMEQVRQMVDLAHRAGARVGLEHAGERLTESMVLLESGLDFVKLDASFVEHIATDAARREHVVGAVRMLHGMGLKVYAEGVSSPEDAQALGLAGLDGLTGPVVPPG